MIITHAQIFPCDWPDASTRRCVSNLLPVWLKFVKLLFHDLPSSPSDWLVLAAFTMWVGYANQRQSRAHQAFAIKHAWSTDMLDHRAQKVHFNNTSCTRRVCRCRHLQARKVTASAIATPLPPASDGKLQVFIYIAVFSQVFKMKKTKCYAPQNDTF